MKKTVVEYYCDLCESKIDLKKLEKRELSTTKKSLETEVQVLFTTEQTEGQPTTPYIQSTGLHLCQECFNKYKASLPISASGAQGHNNYRWR